MMSYGDWKPYVSVAKRRQTARKEMDKLRKKGVDIQPIIIEGRKIVTKFWGEAWCDHLESYSDFENRLPRGRTYVRNGSVCHLAIKKGAIEAKVSGSEIYDVRVQIKTIPNKKWIAVKKRCSGQISSLLELLRGDLSDSVMSVVTNRQTGLFPSPSEISYKCNCPDWAGMCKHIAAVLYGIGARFDQEPALLFRLRGVNHEELIEESSTNALPTGSGKSSTRRIASNELSDVFGIELAAESMPDEPHATIVEKTSPSAAKNGRKTVAKKRSKASTNEVVSKSAGKLVKTAKKTAGKKTVKIAKKKAVSKTTKKTTIAKTKRVDTADSSTPAPAIVKKKLAAKSRKSPGKKVPVAK